MSMIVSLQKERRLKKFKQEIIRIVLDTGNELRYSTYTDSEAKIVAGLECVEAYDEWAKEVLRKNGTRKK